MSDLVIIGGGPGAWSCAVTAINRGLSCTVVTTGKKFSGLTKAHLITNYPGIPVISGEELMDRMEKQARDMGTEVIEGNARQIMPSGDQYMTLVGNDILTSPAVVLALGAARPKLLPGEEELLGHGVSWCGTCDGMFYRKKPVAVLSAWAGGAEDAEFLANVCSSVDYYTLQPHEKPSDERIRFVDGKPTALRQEEGQIVLTTDQGEAAYSGVFIFRPSVAPGTLLPGLQLEGNAIYVDRRMATNLPRVYACGDCTGQPLQIAKAVGEGNVAAISAAQDIAELRKGKQA
ncbi:MAG: NAD(P)/FAD-dependent oxidoreductase, partial [Oscillospiraceae bacterium]|nr:NAD(P)/FAD-dependent oxidoreductase [Oscillospiraceae bacterium]